MWCRAIAVVFISALTIAGCQRSKAPVERPEPRVSDWESGLSVEMDVDVSTVGDSVAVTAVATATNITRTTRDLCVNLHFVAAFQEDRDRQEDDPPVEPTTWTGARGVHEIARSPWRKYGRASCARRNLAPGEPFQDQFEFKYSKTQFAEMKGDVYVMCEVWFQTRVDIPNQSLTCDMVSFGFKKVPNR